MTCYIALPSSTMPASVLSPVSWCRVIGNCCFVLQKLGSNGEVCRLAAAGSLCPAPEAGQDGKDSNQDLRAAAHEEVTCSELRAASQVQCCHSKVLLNITTNACFSCWSIPPPALQMSLCMDRAFWYITMLGVMPKGVVLSFCVCTVNAWLCHSPQMHRETGNRSCSAHTLSSCTDFSHGILTGLLLKA